MPIKMFLVILISYLLGNIQASYILGKVILKKDIRNYGSSNAGTTNALRVFGKKIAIATLLIDVLKGVIAVFLGKEILLEKGEIVAGLFVVIGHIWPIFMRFKGGKGVATSIGAGLILTPITSVLVILLGLIILKKTKYVSLSAIISIIMWPIFNTFFYFRRGNIEILIISIIIAIIVVFKHKENIRRLINGSENKIGTKI